MSKDSIHEEFHDLLQEVPEAEDAIRAYQALRAKQSLDAARACTIERDRRRQEAAWDALRNQLRMRGLSCSNAFH